MIDFNKNWVSYDQDPEKMSFDQFVERSNPENWNPDLAMSGAEYREKLSYAVKSTLSVESTDPVIAIVFAEDDIRLTQLKHRLDQPEIGQIGEYFVEHYTASTGLASDYPAEIRGARFMVLSSFDEIILFVAKPAQE